MIARVWIRYWLAQGACDDLICLPFISVPTSETSLFRSYYIVMSFAFTLSECNVFCIKCICFFIDPIEEHYLGPTWLLKKKQLLKTWGSPWLHNSYTDFFLITMHSFKILIENSLISPHFKKQALLRLWPILWFQYLQQKT